MVIENTDMSYKLLREYEAAYLLVGLADDAEKVLNKNKADIYTRAAYEILTNIIDTLNKNETMWRIVNCRLFMLYCVTAGCAIHFQEYDKGREIISHGIKCAKYDRVVDELNSLLCLLEKKEKLKW
jgi:hypothetical protein